MRISKAWLWTAAGFVTATVLIAAAAAAARVYHAAQWDLSAAMAEYGYEKPLLPFAAVMGAAVTAVVATVVALWRARLTVPAVATAAGAGIGPMSLLAFPVWEGPGTTEVGDGAPALLFGAAFTAVVVLIAAVVATRLDPELRDRPVPSWRITGVYVLLAAGGFLTINAVPSWTYDDGHKNLDLTMVAGWVLLAAGLLVAGAAGHEGRAATAVRSLVLMAFPLGLAAVMNRPGGWPEAPGWELAHSNLPLYLTVQMAGIVMGCAAIGWALSYTSWHPVDAPSGVAPA